MSQKKRARLVFENGKEFAGFSFAAHNSTSGEVVFNTAMTGYTESLSNPSFSGQILVLTYPLIGNYGVPKEDVLECGLSKFFESDKIHIRGLVVSDYSFTYSHWSAIKSLADWLKEHDIPAIYGVDTRAITKMLREEGTMLGKIVVEGTEEITTLYDPDQENLIAKASISTPTTYGEGNTHIVVADYGCTNNLIRSLITLGVKVTRVPWDYDFTKIDCQGVVLSDGAGNPTHATQAIEIVRKAIEKKIPIFGTGIGHQILALAAGASVSKLKYGHHSANQPVIKVGTESAIITSQHHGYAVDASKLDEQWQQTYVSLNDGTNEGIAHTSGLFSSIQFATESTIDAQNADNFLRDFIKSLSNAE